MIQDRFLYKWGAAGASAPPMEENEEGAQKIEKIFPFALLIPGVKASFPGASREGPFESFDDIAQIRFRQTN